MFRARTHAGNLPHRTAELSDAAVAAAEPTGFENRTDSTLGFTTSTRTVDVTPTSDAFHVWEASRKSRFESAQTLAITNVTGTHIVYFDEGVIAESVNPADSAIDTLIRTKPLACHVYWNATDGAAVYVGEERHGINYPGDVHSDMHWNRGFARQFGLALNTLSTDQDGSSNAHAQFGTDAGGANDEDIHHSIAAVASATGLPILYKTGASGEWHRTTNAGYSVTTIGTGRLAYNEWTGATWQLTEVTNGRYVLCHVVATGDKDTPMMAIVGEEEYTNIVDARQGATTEIGTISTAGLPGPEMLFLATVILQTSNSYTNAVKARTRTADTGDDYLWWGDSGVTRTNPPGNNDPDAFHQSASGEIAGLTEKTAPASGDNFLIEDNASSDSKSRVDAVRLILADGTNPLTADWDAGSSRDIKCAIHFAQDGTAIAPSFAFTNDADNGLYLKSTNTLGISTAKIERAYVDSAGKLWVLYAADFADDVQIDGELTVDGGINLGTSFPGSPVDGLFYYRTDLDEAFYYDGTRTAWVSYRVFEVTFGVSAATGGGAYLEDPHGNTTSSTHGWRAPYDLIGCELEYSHTAAPTITYNILARKNGVSTSFGISTGTNQSGDHQGFNISFSANDIISGRVSGNTQSGMYVTFRFRRTAT